MNPPCAKCSKTVYPTEKLNCLDKIWHKGCFKCTTCGMTLNMKNYKGYKKMPYCNAHYPTNKPTAVADTPENMRIKKNTTNQSSVVYQKEFVKEKGKYTSVTDDPETMRARKTQQQASDLKYHEKFEQEKGVHTSVADDPETLRARKTQQQASDLKYHEKFEQEKGAFTPVADDPETMRTRKTQQQASDLAYKGTSREDDAPRRGSQSSRSPPSSISAAPPQPTYEPEPVPEPEPEPAPAPPSGGSGKTYVALYDYTAADEDEVSFEEGDRIIDGDPIDEGWMTGTVERTGQQGMLPSNYVEPC